jgi:hypothetical protein
MERRGVIPYLWRGLYSGPKKSSATFVNAGKNAWRRSFGRLAIIGSFGREQDRRHSRHLYSIFRISRRPRGTQYFHRSSIKNHCTPEWCTFWWASAIMRVVRWWLSPRITGLRPFGEISVCLKRPSARRSPFLSINGLNFRKGEVFYILSGGYGGIFLRVCFAKCCGKT